MKCSELNARGEPCESLEELVGRDGKCQAHREGGLERLREISAKGGEATKAKSAGRSFTDAEIPPMTTTDEVRRFLVFVGNAEMKGEITHNSLNAQTRRAEAVLKALAQEETHSLVTQLRRQLDANKAENTELRRQIAELRPHALRVAR